MAKLWAFYKTVDSVYVAALLPGQNMMLSLEKESKGVLISTLEYT